MTSVTEITAAEETQILQLGRFVAKAYTNGMKAHDLAREPAEGASDPIVRFWMGTEYAEDTAAWDITHTEDVRKASKIGRIFAAHTAPGELVGLAVAFSPGNDMGDLPNGDELKGVEDSLSSSQKEFRADFTRKQTQLYADSYPATYKRDNLHLFHLVVRQDCRGTGIGTRLFERLIEECKSAGCELVFDTSKPANVRFYENRGAALKGSFEVEHPRFGALPVMFALSSELLVESQ